MESRRSTGDSVKPLNVLNSGTKNIWNARNILNLNLRESLCTQKITYFTSILGVCSFRLNSNHLHSTAVLVTFIGIGSNRCFAFADNGSKSGDDFLKWIKGLAERRDSNHFELISDEVFNQASKKVHNLIEDGLIGKIGYGFTMGYASGLCLKKVSKIVGVLAGGMFITIQYLGYKGYIDVNYKKLQKDVENIMDFNKDGKVDITDFQTAYGNVHSVLSYNMPQGGGFTAGFVAGLRS
eukprot:gene6691-13555_t